MISKHKNKFKKSQFLCDQLPKVTFRLCSSRGEWEVHIRLRPFLSSALDVVVNARLRPPYSLENNLRYWLSKRLGVPQCRSTSSAKQTRLVTLSGTDPLFGPTHDLVNITTTPPWHQNPLPSKYPFVLKLFLSRHNIQDTGTWTGSSPESKHKPLLLDLKNTEFSYTIPRSLVEVFLKIPPWISEQKKVFIRWVYQTTRRHIHNKGHTHDDEIV